MLVTGRQRGFSLIEALVAAAILLLISLSVTGTVLATMDAGRGLDNRLYLEQSVEAERVRLTALPYFRPTSTAMSTSGRHAPEKSLVADVFPHAQPEHNTAEASFGEDEEGALFVTRVLEDGVSLERTARFARRDLSGVVYLSVADLQRWAVWQSWPPTTTLEITLVATRGKRSVTRPLRVTAPAPILPPVTSDRPALSP